MLRLNLYRNRKHNLLYRQAPDPAQVGYLNLHLLTSYYPTLNFEIALS